MNVLLPLAGNSLDQALQIDRGLRNEESVAGALETFRSLVESIRGAVEATLSPFGAQVKAIASGAWSNKPRSVPDEGYVGADAVGAGVTGPAV
jgi:hypothetical protein